MNAKHYHTSAATGTSCIGCKYSTRRRIDTHNGICAEGGAVNLVKWEDGRCNKYSSGERETT